MYCIQLMASNNPECLRNNERERILELLHPLSSIYNVYICIYSFIYLVTLIQGWLVRGCPSNGEQKPSRVATETFSLLYIIFFFFLYFLFFFFSSTPCPFCFSHFVSFSRALCRDSIQTERKYRLYTRQILREKKIYMLI